MNSDPEIFPGYWFALAIVSLPALWVLQVIWIGAIFIVVGVSGAVFQTIATAVPPVISVGSAISFVLAIVMGVGQLSLLIGMLTFPLTLCCIGASRIGVVQKHFPNWIIELTRDPRKILFRVLLFNFALAPVVALMSM